MSKFARGLGAGLADVGGTLFKYYLARDAEELQSRLQMRRDRALAEISHGNRMSELGVEQQGREKLTGIEQQGREKITAMTEEGANQRTATQQTGEAQRLGQSIAATKENTATTQAGENQRLDKQLEAKDREMIAAAQMKLADKNNPGLVDQIKAWTEILGDKSVAVGDDAIKAQAEQKNQAREALSTLMSGTGLIGRAQAQKDSATNQTLQTLTGGGMPTTQPSNFVEQSSQNPAAPDPFTAGKTYKNSKGQMGRYMGNNQWAPVQ